MILHGSILYGKLIIMIMEALMDVKIRAHFGGGTV
jgi:hypothetical protein